MTEPARPDAWRGHAWRDWLPLAIGLILAFAVLEFARLRLVVKLEEAALGQDTQFVLGGEGAPRTLCMDGKDSVKCLQSYEAAKRPPSVLFLGNSQLPAINRVKAGDRVAPALLHDMMRPRGHYLVTYAQPNANLIEHGLAFAALAPIYAPRLLILPVFLDDIREQGVRQNIAGLLDPVQSRAEAERSPMWAHIAPFLARAGSEQEGAEAQSLQRTFETAFDAWLGARWPLWGDRQNLRGLLAFSVHRGRNKLLGINAQSKRKVDGNIYREKMAVLEAILAHARARNVKVLLYVPPFRLDIPGPYFDADYAKLKTDLQTFAAKYGAHFANLENVVPGPEWGMVVDPVYGLSDYDFMHFTGDGHRRHAEALDRELRKIGF